VALPATPSQTAGPFFSIGMCADPMNELVPAGSAGAIEIRGRVIDGEGEPVPDAAVEVWDGSAGRFGRCGTGADGGYRFVAGRPGPAAEAAPHLAVLVFARGLLKPLLTRIYLPDEAEANAADPVLSALEPDERATLVARPADGGLAFDIRLQGDGQTTFFAL
jgi:protocatechuate 3,4-dioxygenase, alpha subunit